MLPVQRNSQAKDQLFGANQSASHQAYFLNSIRIIPDRENNFREISINRKRFQKNRSNYERKVIQALNFSGWGYNSN